MLYNFREFRFHSVTSGEQRFALFCFLSSSCGFSRQQKINTHRQKKKNCHILETPDKEMRNVGKTSVEWAKVWLRERQKGSVGGEMGKGPPPFRLERVSTVSGAHREGGGGPKWKYLRCSSRGGLHWRHKTEPGWAFVQRGAPTQLVHLKFPAKTFYSNWLLLKTKSNQKLQRFCRKSRAFCAENDKGKFERSGFWGHSSPSGRDMGSESQEEAGTSKALQGTVLRWGALPQGSGSQSDQSPWGVESQAGDRPDECCASNNGAGPAEPAARSPGHRGREQILGDQQPRGDHAASNPTVCYTDLIRWASTVWSSS